jgi:autotransporter-associated beta strand protein
MSQIPSPKHRARSRAMRRSLSSRKIAAAISFAGMMVQAPVVRADSTWATNSSGSWSDAARWIGGVPNATGVLVSLPSFSSTRTIFVDGNFTVGKIIVDGSGSYTVGGTAPNGITFDNGGQRSLLMSRGTGNHRFLTPITTTGDLDISTTNSGTLQLGSFSVNGSVEVNGNPGNGRIRWGGTATIVNGGVRARSGLLRLIDDGAIVGANQVTVDSLGVISLDNSGTAAVNERIPSAAPISLLGGTISLVTGNGAAFNASLGDVNVSQGTGHIVYDFSGPSNANGTLTIASLTRQLGSTVDLGASNNGNNKAIYFATPPVLNDGVIGGWAHSGPTGFVTYSAAGVGTLPMTDVDINAALPNQNVELHFPVSSPIPTVLLAADKTVNSIKTFRPGVLDLNGHTFTIDSGGFATENNVEMTMQNGTLTSGSDALYFYGGGQRISATVADGPAGPTSVVKAGAGSLVLSGANTYTGMTVVNGGALIVEAAAAVPNNNVLQVNGGSYQLNYVDPNPVHLAVLRLRQSGLADAMTGGPKINADSYDLQSGSLFARLSGSGTLVKSSDGSVTMRGDNSAFSGNVFVNGGFLIAGNGQPIAANSGNVLGTGTTTVNAGGRLIFNAFGPLPGAIVLNGGELAGGAIVSPGLTAVSAPVFVTADSSILTYDGFAKFISGDHDMLLSGGLNVSPGVNLSVIGFGTLIVSGPGVSNGGGLIIGGGTASLGAVDGAGGLQIGTVIRVGASHVRQSALSLNGGVLAISSNGTDTGTSRVAAISFAGGAAAPAAALDLSNNDLVIDYSGASPHSDIQQLIRSGYAGGLWNGNGVRSSAANASSFGLGYAEAADLFSQFPATFSGQSIDDTTVLVAFTRYGDANLSNSVDLFDFNRLAANFGQSGKSWSDGDFNYDGDVNLLDFNLLAGNFGLGAGADGVVDPADWAALAAVVPEPIAVSLLAGMAAIAAVAARRRPRREYSKID